jgi:3-dehydroquinate synthase
MDQSLVALQSYVNEFTDCECFVIICDSNTSIHCLPLLLSRVQFKVPHLVLEIPAGEATKNLTTCEYVWQELTDHKINRQAICLNLGGGVVTDLGGFAASLYKRGIRFINIPTTLLAMVDASVGGKTAVDFQGFKNQIGAFSFPLRVFVSSVFLQTLPKQQLLAGFSEMFKHGLLDGGKHWEDVLRTKPEEVLSNPWLIADSIRVKNRFVTLDPYDSHGRKALNLGHTIGHALEAWSLANNPSSPLLHGEAVALGILAETFLATHSGALNTDVFTLVSNWVLERFIVPDFDVDAVFENTLHDKKNKGNEIVFSILNALGDVKIDVSIEAQFVKASLNFLKSKN